MTEGEPGFDMGYGNTGDFEPRVIYGVIVHMAVWDGHYRM